MPARREARSLAILSFGLGSVILTAAVILSHVAALWFRQDREPCRHAG